MRKFSRVGLLASSMLAGMGAAAALSVGAIAQVGAAAQDDDEEAAASNETIVVTGTLLTRAETASPVTTLTGQDLLDRGIVSISDAVNSLAANNAGTVPQNWNVGWNFATGATAVSLRGLTVSSTLTVFDGLRGAAYPLADDGRRNFVDLNAIPQGVVDRIEVLKDGASSTYGADAIAGVVNVITKKEIQGVHTDTSYGLSQEGDGEELRLDLTMGHGDLVNDGFNAYVGFEYQHNDPLRAQDRGYPYNTGDWSQICGSQGECLPNLNRGGIGNDGFFAFGATRVPTFRPYNGSTVTLVDPGGEEHDFAPGTLIQGPYQLLDGCGDLIQHTLTASQQGSVEPTWTEGEDEDGNPNGQYTYNNVIYTGPTYAATQCEENRVGDYQFNAPELTRHGLAGRLTFDLGDAEVYARADWYQVLTRSGITPYGFAGQTAPPGTIVLNPVLLPVYVCSTDFEECDATNGVLNPNNPFAAQGQIARLSEDFIRPRSSSSQADTFRAAAGITGTFGEGWNYAGDLSVSHVNLGITQNGYIYLQHLLDVIHDGSYNFLDQSQNSQAIIDYVAPENFNRSTSDLFLAQATLSKELLELPGGPLQAAVGGSWREERIDNPSANPANDLHPTERYFSVNSVGAEGLRDVWSAFFEVDAPVLPILDLNLSGRYDTYSSGQSSFSPKVGAKLEALPGLSLRGTYSEGFRIPSFNEAYGLPTTGYVSHTVSADGTPGGAAYIAAHGGNAYATTQYNYGLTSTGNPNLDPEESTSFTLGAVYEPTNFLTFTLDYWNIEVDGLITGADYSGVIDEYYANNGVVNIPGITVLPGLIDPDFPNALPRLGFIEYSYQNANSQEVAGVDFSATARVPLFAGFDLTSVANVSYLDKYDKTFASGDVQSYAGTLSPCDVTSCSGAPNWRIDWANTVTYGDTSVTLTAYYTAGVDFASVDYGGIEGDCESSIDASVWTYDDGTPYSCRSDDLLFFDLTGSHKLNNNVEIYGAVLNLLDEDAHFDPAAAYGIYGYNPAWAATGFMGRYFRVGARVDF